MIKYIEGDIHNIIKTLDDNSIDFIYTDPPFNTTEAVYEGKLNWKELFTEMWRVLKPNGIICLYSAMPFTYQPLRCVEEINIYYKKRGTYNPQMEGDTFYKKVYNKQKDKQQHYGHRNNIEKSFVSKTEGHTGKYPTTFKEWNIRRDDTGITRDDMQIDYFIKTYSNENDTILDMTCHNNYVGDRCKLLNRNYIGVDINLQNENNI